ncbi:hypothetical protein RFI_14975 [Reticulomyxa filosa]|uniref:Transmembrane protein n=1 Tax=Reticulomyxa filosa TaxID=46433 RepID=X6N8I8_RETFI|nr:hypothetical protein RFI_14975 [Reticulomyxa filosa]|eukprot:ETO22223.1 hypothetical protein RFI_14975 [Reticulomyxa filosa]
MKPKEDVQMVNFNSRKFEQQNYNNYVCFIFSCILLKKLYFVLKLFWFCKFFRKQNKALAKVNMLSARNINITMHNNLFEEKLVQSFDLFQVGNTNKLV